MESSAQAPVVNCSNLTSRADFESYVKEIQQITNFDFTSLNSCKIPICDALWGSGNADIAGIGVSRAFEPNLELKHLTAKRWLWDMFSNSSLG